MPLTYKDLSLVQRLILNQLDDGYPPEDSVGCRDQDMLVASAEDCGVLLRHGLIEVDWGWQNSSWLRLTDRGRQLKQYGSVD